MTSLLDLYKSKTEQAKAVTDGFNGLMSNVQDATMGDVKQDTVEAKKEVEKATEKLNPNNEESGQAGGNLILKKIVKNNKTGKKRKIYRKNKKLKLKTEKKHNRKNKSN
jgi:hypothetical protein